MRLRPLWGSRARPSQGRAKGKGDAGVQRKGSELGKSRGCLGVSKLKGYSENMREKRSTVQQLM